MSTYFRTKRLTMIVGRYSRKTWYENPEQIQADLDKFMEYHNLKRSHQGYRLKGKTPAQALREALKVKKLPPFIPAEKENATEEVKDAA